jgi:putative ABC transport system permease protein
MGKAIEENMSAWFPYFRVEPSVAVAAGVIAVLLATSAALIPAIQAGRISVTDALRRVG